MPVTKEQVSAAITAIQAIGQAIMELKEVPSGVLYAQICCKMSIQDYESAIRLLVKAGVVEEKGHVLTWIG